MPIRTSRVDEAARRARNHVDEVLRSLIAARLNAGLSQTRVAAALGVSRSLLCAWEARRIVPTPIQLYQWGAVVGLDLSIRAFPGGSPLRDAGQLRLLERFHALIGDAWTWRTEVPVSADPRDRRAFDSVLSRDVRQVAVEAVSRIVDAQGQVRPIMLKEEAAEIDCIVLVVPGSRANRLAVALARPTLEPAFPGDRRATLAALRTGEVPSANALIFV